MSAFVMHSKLVKQLFSFPLCVTAIKLTKSFLKNGVQPLQLLPIKQLKRFYSSRNI